MTSDGILQKRHKSRFSARQILRSSGIARVVLLLAVWCVTLLFGLIPYDNYGAKWVSPAEVDDGIRFGKYGLAFGQIPDLAALDDTNNSLEVNLELRVDALNTRGFQVLAYIGASKGANPIILGQWRQYLVVMQGYDFANKASKPRLTVDITQWAGNVFDWRIVLNQNRNTMYIDGVPVSTHSPSTFSLDKLEPMLSIGNTLNGKQGWAGVINRFTAEHKNTDAGIITPLVEYDFTQVVADDQIRNRVQDANHLTIPEVGRFPEHLFLNDRKLENLFTNSPFDLFINFVGFFPLAFCLVYLLKLQLPNLPPVLVAGFSLIIGVSTSLLIEFTQQYIPGRNSDLHDLVLNSAGVLAGTVIGMALSTVAVWLSHRRMLSRARRVRR